MKTLLALLAVMLSLGAYFSGDRPAPAPESPGPSCRDEDCLKARRPAPARPARGPECPGGRCRADFPPPGG